MSATVVPINIVLRVDTAANWTEANPVLLLGEEGYERDTRSKKIGDGVSVWNSLPYYLIQGLPAVAIFDSIGRVKYGVLSGEIIGQDDEGIDIWDLRLTTVVS
jgi:hypothetical protein